MINASTLGLHGTQRLQKILPHDDWIYLPDIIQEGNAIQSIDPRTATYRWAVINEDAQV